MICAGIGSVVPTHLAGAQPTISASACGAQRTRYQSPKAARISTAWPRSKTTPSRGASADGFSRSQTLPVINPISGAAVGVAVGAKVGDGVIVEVGVAVGLGARVGVGVEVGVGVSVKVGDGVGVLEGVEVGAMATSDGTTAGLRVVRQAHPPAKQAPTRQRVASPAAPTSTRLWVGLTLRGWAAVINELSDDSTGASELGSPW